MLEKIRNLVKTAIHARKHLTSTESVETGYVYIGAIEWCYDISLDPNNRNVRIILETPDLGNKSHWRFKDVNGMDTTEMLLSVADRLKFIDFKRMLALSQTKKRNSLRQKKLRSAEGKIELNVDDDVKEKMKVWLTTNTGFGEKPWRRQAIKAVNSALKLMPVAEYLRTTMRLEKEFGKFLFRDAKMSREELSKILIKFSTIKEMMANPVYKELAISTMRDDWVCSARFSYFVEVLYHTLKCIEEKNKKERKANTGFVSVGSVFDSIKI